ncbi:MAG: OmpA family protein [Bacteroidetes bacterium]|nr:OmpA family protein [Bacteroidota bacterium]
MKILNYVLLFLLIQVVECMAGEKNTDNLKTSEQLTKDLIVTGTRGISVQPNSANTYETSSVSAPVESFATQEESNGGRVDVYIQFNYAKSNLTERSKIQLYELAKAINGDRLRNDSFLVAGHTDAAGKDEYNLALSKQRATSVVHYLSSILDIDKNRLIARGFGEQFLKDEANPKSGVNRRVEIVNTKALQ